MKGKTRVLIFSVILSLIALSVLINDLCYAGEVVFKEVIRGKEYRIEKAEAGKYWVSWGDEKILWVPKPYYQRVLKEKGPLFYHYWSTPKPTIPWELSMEEREKITDASDIYMRSSPTVMLNGFAKDKIHEADNRLMTPTGKSRVNGSWGALRDYRQHPDKIPPGFKGKALLKSVMFLTQPPDVYGIAILNVMYQDVNRDDDVWLYMPSTRKVKRMTAAHRADAASGTTYKNEDMYLFSATFHNYEIIGYKLMQDPGEKVYGFAMPEKARDKWEAQNIGHDGVGEPCYVIKCTPKREWWFGHKIMYIGLWTFNEWMEYRYDKKGRLISTVLYGTRTNPKAPDYYLSFNRDYSEDLLSGYRTATLPIREKYDVGYPDSLYAPSMLDKPLDKLYSPFKGGSVAEDRWLALNPDNPPE